MTHEQIVSLAGRKAVLTRFYGPDHPDTIEAARKLAAARLSYAVEAARDSGLDSLDIMSVVQAGELPATVAA
jgi:hypothetical protein